MNTIYHAEPLPLAEAGDSGFTGSDSQRPENYLPDPGLIAAVKVAIMLSRPLLLTGEPGSGKTRLAYHLAWDHKLGEPLRFDTKSTSDARDLFYTYDAIGHFHAAKIREDKDPSALPHISLNALGLAILQTLDKAALEKSGLLPLLEKEEIKPDRPCRSVVLIDEIDKAPRDFPNDILNEVENLCFTIHELGHNRKIQVSPKLKPILILTSNSEKHLPDAFMRRCIYYDIPFPEDKERLQEIIDLHIEELSPQHKTRFDEALDFFIRLRRPETGLKKKPATAELLNWLLILKQTCEAAKPLIEQSDSVLLSFSGLVKNVADQQAACREWENYRQTSEYS
ncbi:MAG: MoxR family ATPase [Gammaproteobacteria bacterium]|nr:MoxR family ATPase [Gammaproteobacteria bacterium]